MPTDQPPATPVRRAVTAVSGGALIAAGLVAMPLPIIPGWALVAGGVAILSKHYRWAANLADRARLVKPGRAPTAGQIDRVNSR